MALKLGELVTYLRADDTALARGIRSAKEKLQQAGDQMRQQGPVIGAALAAGIGAGLLAGMDLEKARAKLSAQIGDPVLAKQLGEVAGEVYGRGFGETAADAMLAARAVMQSGLLPKGVDAAVIEDITVKAQALAQVFDLDVSAAARAAGQMIRTGLAKDASEALDLITRGFQISGDQAGDLLDSFSEYSTQFRKLGLSGADAMGLMIQGTKAGARDLDVVSDALKEFAIRAADGSKTSAEGFTAIGLNAEKMTAIFAKGGPAARDALGTVLERLQAMKDPTEREAAAVALFGTKAEDLQGALGGLNLDKAASELGKVGGAADQMGKTLEESSAQKLEAFKRQAQSALVEKLAEALPYIEGVVRWMKEHKGIVEPLAVTLGVLATVIGLIVVATKLWAIAQIALNVAMMLNPVGLIILAVIGLVMVIVGLWMKFEGFREFWKKTWEIIKGAAIAVWDFIVAAAKAWWELFSGFWTGVADFFVGLWDGIVAGAKLWWKGIVSIFDKVVDFVSGLPKKIGRAASGMWDGIKNSFKSAVNWIIRKWNDLSLTIGGGSIMGVNIPSVTLSTPNIPMLANGGHILRAGTAVVGERGPELVHLGQGATVQPLTGRAAGAAGGHAELRITGELVARGQDLVLVLRERVAIDGGSVQAVIGSDT